MSQISVTIDGRKYRLACNEGEEARLESLAGMIDDKIGEMRSTFGEIGDQRLVIMAALTIADNLTEARETAEAERKRSEASEQRAQAMASRLDELGSRLESVVARLAGEAGD
jgi:cell division protein ZapA